MKVLAKVLVIIFLAGTQNLFAKEENTLATLVTVKQLDQGKVQLTYYGKSPENIYVQIINDKDKPVFRETIKSKRGVQKPYNISQLPEGTYIFKVRVDDEEITHTIKHKAPDLAKNIVMQTSAFGEGKLKLMIMTPGKKDFKLRLYDEHNRLILQERIDQTRNFGKVYNLEELRVNSVKIVLSNSTQILKRETVAL